MQLHPLGQPKPLYKTDLEAHPSLDMVHRGWLRWLGCATSIEALAPEDMQQLNILLGHRGLLMDTLKDL